MEYEESFNSQGSVVNIEIWKDIEGYEGLYQVSNLGRVKSLKFNKIKILSQGISGSGYKIASLSKENQRKIFLVHRLVAMVFIKNPNNYPCINHKDENKLNNLANNLEWCTHRYNCNYKNHNKNLSKSLKSSEKIKNKKLSEKHKKNISKSIKGNKNPRARKILCITTGEIFSYIEEVEEKYNIKTSGISACCRGDRKSAGKHPITGEKMVWKYID